MIRKAFLMHVHPDAHAEYLGGNRWDFSRLHTMPIDRDARWPVED